MEPFPQYNATLVSGPYINASERMADSVNQNNNLCGEEVNTCGEGVTDQNTRMSHLNSTPNNEHVQEPTCTRCGNHTIPSEFHIHVIHACPLDLKAQTLNRGSLFMCRPRCYGFNVTASGSERIDNVIKCVVVTLYLKALDIRLFSPLTLLTSEPSRTTQYRHNDIS